MARGSVYKKKIISCYKMHYSQTHNNMYEKQTSLIRPVFQQQRYKCRSMRLDTLDLYNHGVMGLSSRRGFAERSEPRRLVPARESRSQSTSGALESHPDAITSCRHVRGRTIANLENEAPSWLISARRTTSNSSSK